jgi:mono/diheme cytochrome c family protein
LHGRVDAFGYARNFLFGNKHGFTPNTAPVSYPHLWGFQHTGALHWNANTNSVLERNIGQALGVGGIVSAELDTTVILENLHELEAIAYNIVPPTWPAMLPKIDSDKAARGKPLYTKHCASCHDSEKKDPTTGLTAFVEIPLADIGTDPNQAHSFAAKLGDGSFADALATTLEGIKQKYYAKKGTTEQQRSAWEAGRAPSWWKSPLVYAARSLRGAWATAPFLHNNSVPSLYHLLLPAAKRPTKFQVGSREYDPTHVGYVSSEGGVELDTTLSGNSNAGHAYGTSLSEDDRWALVEYLKTL